MSRLAQLHTGARIHFTEAGDPDGPPVLLIAPGGMRSTFDKWTGRPWDPLQRLSGFRVIAMDQRNAGRSTAPIRPGEGWDSYTADQLALMDHLGIDRFQVIGMCIGGAYIMGLLRAAPGRVQSATMFQPIGLDNNRTIFYELFDRWGDTLRDQHPDADWDAFRHAMFGGDFLFNASRAHVSACRTPILLLRGDDPYHPASISDEIAALAPDTVTMIRDWKSPEDADAADPIIQGFLRRHSAAGVTSPRLEELVGMPLSGIHLAAGMLSLSLGPLRTITDRRGQPRQVGTLALHIQSPWRVSRNGAVVLSQQDAPMHTDDATAPLLGACVSRVSHTGDGALTIELAGALQIEVLPSPGDDAPDLEWWRLFRPYDGAAHRVFGPAHSEGVDA